MSLAATRERLRYFSGAWLLIALTVPVSVSHAAVEISTKTTRNMICSAGICTPTATDAVLNVSDLGGLLASGNVTVTTTGSEDVQADDIDVTNAVSWSTNAVLALDAYESINIGNSVAVQAQGGLLLTTDDGGSGGQLSISQKGSVVFGNLSSPLTINGTSYALVGSISTLASAIAANPSGAYALANSYDASADGTYTESPIQTDFGGALDGLGNTITNLSIESNGSNNVLGLFNEIVSGTVEHMHLRHLDIGTSKKGDLSTGAFAGINYGYLFETSVSGKIRFRGVQGIGGLVSTSGGTIEDCSADVDISGTRAGSAAGGLVEFNAGMINESFATGSVTVGNKSIAGGLVGGNGSLIENSYATGAVVGGTASEIGGMSGEETQKSNTAVSTSYSTGAVSGGLSSLVGGFVGKSNKTSNYTGAYWDVTTSGTSQAAGEGNSRGIVGQTTEELQSGLPAGFDPAIWGLNRKINNSLPYLLNNPPPK